MARLKRLGFKFGSNTYEYLMEESREIDRPKVGSTSQQLKDVVDASVDKKGALISARTRRNYGEMVQEGAQPVECESTVNQAKNP